MGWSKELAQIAALENELTKTAYYHCTIDWVHCEAKKTLRYSHTPVAANHWIVLLSTNGGKVDHYAIESGEIHLVNNPWLVVRPLATRRYSADYDVNFQFLKTEAYILPAEDYKKIMNLA